MRNRILGVLTLLGVSCLAATTLAQPVASDVRQAVEEKLELVDFSIQRLELPDGNTSFFTELTLDGREYGVSIEPESFRSDGAPATTNDGNGRVRQIALPEFLTVRAQFEGMPEVRAAGSRMGGGLHLTISLPGAGANEIWSVQPLTDAVPDADPTLHVVHRADDVLLQERWTCGVDDNGPRVAEFDNGDGGFGSRGFLVCEIACDADFEYYGRNGSSESNTIADIDTIIARMAAIYEGQCNVTFRIPHYQIWTTSADPYTSTDPGTRLTQLRNWWNSNMGHIQRDLVHGFTGANINGNVIGIAWLSAVCGSNGYGLVQSRYTSNMNNRGALSAHEVGHNFSAGHCDGSGDCHIMCSGLGGCNGLGNPAFFGTASANKIRNYAAGRGCLEEDGLSYPFLEEWTSTTIDSFTWPTNSGGIVNTNGDNEPSGPYSLNLDSTDSIASAALDLSSVVETPYVSFYTQHKGVEAGKTLTFEFNDFLDNWVTLFTITSDGNNQTEFEFHTAPVPVTGWGENFAMRISVQGSAGNDDWYVDDVTVAPFAGNMVPFVEEFSTTSPDQNHWQSLTGSVINTDATNEPSDPYSLNFDSADTATSNSFLMGDAPFPTFISFYTQHKGVESGESIIAEYMNISGDWLNLTTVTSNGNDQSSFVFYQSQVPFDSYHDDFAFRFRAQGSDNSDDWYVDDIRIGEEFTPPNDCVADFNGDGDVNTLDMLAFLNAWNAGDSSGDINGDGNIDTLDVLAFLNLWNAGC